MSEPIAMMRLLLSTGEQQFRNVQSIVQEAGLVTIVHKEGATTLKRHAIVGVTVAEDVMLPEALLDVLRDTSI